MTPDELFDALVMGGDESLSRDALGAAASRLGWHWPEAPLFAVLDRLTVDGPLRREDFRARVRTMAADGRGPFGRVLRELAPLPAPEPTRGGGQRVAWLVIDPQRSFTRGSWMQSIGPEAKREVAPLAEAFERCAARVSALGRRPEAMFTRCPFPPDSYDWDDALRDRLEPTQPYFVKPGNSVLWPPTNGFTEWVGLLLAQGFDTLVMGGCTLNSCVRVSATEVQRRFGREGLQVVVDRSLCGARASNYLPSAQFGGRSSVESAVQEMTEAGVQVVDGTSLAGEWTRR